MGKLANWMVVTLSAGLLFGCSGSQKETQLQAGNTPAAGSHHITIAQFGHVFLYMPLYVAIDRGMFKKHGLDVSLVSTGGDEKTFTAVSTGNAQFGVSDPTFTAIAREHGQGGKVVAAVVRGVPFWLVTMKKDLQPIKDAHELNGLRCASFTAPSTSYAVMKRILEGGKADKATIVQGAFGTLPALLKSEKADVAIEIEPTVSILVSQGGRVIYSPKAELGDFAFTGLEVSDAFAKKHPEQIQACVDALKDAMAFIHNDFEGAVAVAQKQFPDVAPNVVRDALERLRDSGTIPASPDLPKAAWDSAIALRKQLGDIKSGGSYEENVDMQYVNKASR